jgi:nicotinamide riboside transporter PnuC
MTPLQHTLWKEFGKQMLISIGIFAALFIILYIVEWRLPILSGTLLQWHDPAFLVGIPASVIGVAYVLTIRNPKNYTGFVGGIIMSLLLAVQFYLLGNIDLVILQLCVFIPFLLSSLLRWRRISLQADKDDSSFTPQWLPIKQQVASLALMMVILVADYALATEVIQHNTWCDNITLKLMGGMMIASSTLANFILIYQKIDAWIWWVIYAISGMIFYALIGNSFSFVLFTVFLLVNGGTGIAWIKLRQ